MRKQDELLVPRGPDAAALLQEERNEKLRLEDIRRTDEERTDFNYAQRAISDGEQYVDQRGKRIRGHGRNPLLSSMMYPYSAGRTVSDDFARTALIAMSWNQLLKGIQSVYSAAAIIAPINVMPAPPSPKLVDPELSYGEMLVSERTYKKLAEESAEIEQLNADIDASTDPWLENDMRDVRTKKVRAYDMRLLPDKSGYIHCQARVEEMEEAAQKLKGAEANFPVMVYYVRHETSDGMHVDAVIGDAFDDQPAEAVVTGDHKAPQVARPIQPPGLHYIG